MSQKSSSKTKVEVECRYGTACNRKGCFYKHSKPRHRNNDSSESAGDICFAYLAGTCTFDSRCYNRHPNDDDCESIMAALKTKPCRFGRNCYTEGCLYSHGEAVDGARSLDATIKTPQVPIVKASGPVFKDEGMGEVPTISNLRIVKIPESVWRTYPENIAVEAFGIENPIQRFAFVNSKAKPAPSIVDNEGCFVLDLHFQSTKTVELVLNQIFPQCLRYLSADFGTSGNNIWLVTGTGSSVPKGHQVRGGVLYESVLKSVIDLATKHDWLEVSEGLVPGGARGAIRLRYKR